MRLTKQAQDAENREGVRQLVAAGDNPAVLRTVAHFANFPDTARATAFASVMKADCFDVNAEVVRGVGIEVTVWRKETLLAGAGSSWFDDAVWRVRSVAEDNQGEYDGWDCLVTTG